MSGARMTPWWDAIRIRPEIINAAGQIDDVQMSLYNAVYATGALRPAYADATYYAEITYPTDLLVGLLAEISVRLGGGSDYTKARALTRLDQGMGGGKSHACIGCWQLACHPVALAQTDLGKAVFARAAGVLGRSLPPDLNNPHVVVLPCDNMTPGAPVREIDGPAYNLYERFLWRLFSKDYTLYERYAPYFNDKSKIAEALRALNRPVLIIVDEIMDYFGNGLDGAGKIELVAQDMAFLRALLDAVNDVPNVAMLVVMIGSDTIALGTDAARERRTDLHDLMERNGLPATVTANADFADILRRRLFDQPPPEEIVVAAAHAFDGIHTDKPWTKNVWDNIPGTWRSDFVHEVRRTYPFHPMLMHLAEHEWATVTGFQKVRSTIRIFAASVYALQQRGKKGDWAPALIGPGDLPLSNNNVREAILGSGLVGDQRTVANFRALAENEIVNQNDDDGAARRLDLLREPVPWSATNPRAAERGATFIFLTSIVGSRPGGRRGASAPEVKATLAAPDPDFTLTDADGVVADLVNQDKGMSAVEAIAGQGNNKPARYYLSTKLTYRTLVNSLRKTVTDDERDHVIVEFAQRLANTGPFKVKRFITADLARTPTDVLATAGLDDARTTRLFILDPAQFSLRNGIEQRTIQALKVAVGLGEGTARLPVEWASSAVFAVANTQRRARARALGVEYLARQRALSAPEVQADADLTITGNKELATAKLELEKAVKRAFQHVAYLAQPNPDADRALDQITFDDENQSALDGTQVWKALADKEKVFDAGQFTARVLLYHLRDQDYGRPLSEIRDAFWNSPRLPLLYTGEADLQEAIYRAVASDELAIVDGSSQPVAVTDSSQVNLASVGLRLARPLTREDSEIDGPRANTRQEQPGGTSGAGSTASRAAGGAGGTATPTDATPAEKFVTFPLVGNLFQQPHKSEDMAQVFRTLYSMLDEGAVSYLQGTLQLVVDASAADKLAEQMRALGLDVTVRDQ